MESSDIKELWKKKKYSEESSDNTLTDIATTDFGCASSSSQSKKKDNFSEVDQLMNCLFTLCYIVQFC